MKLLPVSRSYSGLRRHPRAESRKAGQLQELFPSPPNSTHCLQSSHRTIPCTAPLIPGQHTHSTHIKPGPLDLIERYCSPNLLTTATSPPTEHARSSGPSAQHVAQDRKLHRQGHQGLGRRFGDLPAVCPRPAIANAPRSRPLRPRTRSLQRPAERPRPQVSCCFICPALPAASRPRTWRPATAFAILQQGSRTSAEPRPGPGVRRTQS